MELYTFFKQFHSGFRYIVLILVVLALVTAIAGWLGKKNYSEGNRKLNMFAMISAHIQFLLGLALYFVSPYVQFTSETMKNAETRYWTMEHVVMMFIAIVLLTVGHAKSKRASLPEGKHKTIALFYGLALIIVVVAIILSKRPFFGITA
ncbi:cytochrome B [Mucilaginibacter hurinus]|uniref:Cytochrome B n=1 Tax=Mucilaginibacter hurinus TaxID=2201324 RepID=A0A367GP99_9SPHI|nr:cytochrome B [Mucilaginibacter hurinus]RCH54481.1 cytochrome B [Mucilaginibacter hurinus]